MGCSWSLRGEIWELISSRKKRVLIVLGLAFIYGNYMGLWDVKKPEGDGYQIARFTNNRIGWFNRYKLGGLQTFSSPGWDQGELVDIYGWWIQPCIGQSQKIGTLCDHSLVFASYKLVCTSLFGQRKITETHGGERGFNTAWCHLFLLFPSIFRNVIQWLEEKLAHPGTTKKVWKSQCLALDLVNFLDAGREPKISQYIDQVARPVV